MAFRPGLPTEDMACPQPAPRTQEPDQKANRADQSVGSKALPSCRFSATAATCGPGRPRIIAADELDRCCPDQTLEILEVTGHFLAVPHVRFVPGANFTALENRIKARYGDGIDAFGYLQEFPSLRVELPEHIRVHKRMATIGGHAERRGQEMRGPSKHARHPQAAYPGYGASHSSFIETHQQDHVTGRPSSRKGT